MKKEIKTNTEVNGAVLTDSALATIKHFQKNDNENLDIYLNTISDAVCFIGKMFQSLPNEWKEEASYVISDLSLVRDEFKDLAKP